MRAQEGLSVPTYNNRKIAVRVLCMLLKRHGAFLCVIHAPSSKCMHVCCLQVSFNAPELVAKARADGKERHAEEVTAEHVSARLADLMQAKDLSKYII